MKLAALIAVLTTAFGAPFVATGAEYVPAASIEAGTGNLVFQTAWRPADGLRLKLTATNSSATLELRISLDGATLNATPPSAFPRAFIDGARYHLEALPASGIPDAEITLKIRDELWAVYLQGRPVAAFPPPFTTAVMLHLPTDQMPESGTLESRFQRVGSLRFHDDFLVPEGDDNALGSWEIESGEWKLHSVLDHIAKGEQFRTKKNRPMPARSANFYSLYSTGSNAMITTGYFFYDTYTYEAAVNVSPGESGLLFMYRAANDTFAFTVDLDDTAHTARLSLKRYTPAETGPVTIAAVDTGLTPGQWVKLRVKTYFNRVQCYLDGIRVIDEQVELPDGGLVGLLSATESGTRFDDVDLRGNYDLDLSDFNTLRHYTVYEHGTLFPRGPLSRLFLPRDTWDTLTVAGTRKPRWIAVGSPNHAPHVFSARFAAPRKRDGAVGLLAGFRDAAQPHFRFTRRNTPAGRVYWLEHVSPEESIVVEEIALPPLPDDTGRESFVLTIGAGSDGTLRMYDGNDLVLMHAATNVTGGSSGLFIGAETATSISEVRYYFAPENEYRNRFEKNRVFADDAFMRHWSSPEGEWIKQTNGLTWHKGDFFGRFDIRMPFRRDSSIHLGVPEDRIEGDVLVKATKNHVQLHQWDRANGRHVPVAEAPIWEFSSDSTNTFYTVHHEGHWTWITSGGVLMMKHGHAETMPGRRVRIDGFTTKELTRSLVHRYNVKDHIFEESLHEWVINGGRWEVVNRFNCDPRWSHMNGESANSVACLWSKHRISGDFCIEVYVGARHGDWYQRVGDMNVTVMSPGHTANQGYTVTCTGWDFDHSQLFTRLYRNGEIVRVSDRYLAPRTREGNVRRGYNPGLKSGRPVHGAWYYIKLRRIGNRLEYFFDNELVFTHEDDDPLRSGSVGLWTYRNSLMIARAKIAAESVRPRSIVFTPVDLETPQPSEPPAEEPAGALVLRNHGENADFMALNRWRSGGDAGHGRMIWHRTEDGVPYFEMRSSLGAGKLQAFCETKPISMQAVAGFAFDLRRTADAQFNFHYDIGLRNKKTGKLTGERHYFHRISGSSFTEGEFKRSGETPVPGEPFEARDDAWTPVTVWLPPAEMVRSRAHAKLALQVIGFGNRQPSYVMQGLEGNRPGAAYAVKNFTIIRFEPPELTLGTVMRGVSFAVSPLGGGGSWTNFLTLSGLNAHLQAIGGEGLVQRRLRARSETADLQLPLNWVNLPDHFNPTLSWDPRRPGAFQISSGSDYPDPRFLAARARLGRAVLALKHDDVTTRSGYLPRRHPYSLDATNTFSVMLSSGTNKMTLSLGLDQRPENTAPVLTDIDGAAALCMNFEDYALRKPLSVNAAMMRVRHHDATHGSYLETGNRGRSRRLAVSWAPGIDLAPYPILQLRYRASRMAKVTLDINGANFVHLSENLKTASDVRYGAAWQLDRKWHTWTGLLSDGMKSIPFDSSAFAVTRVGIQSRAKTDQSGLHSTFDLDEVVLGPAVSRPDQLAFTPSYYDQDGVESVSMALLSGDTAAWDASDEVLAALDWQPIANRQAATPAIDGLDDGVNHLLIRARDVHGLESAVTDIPFLLDRQAPRRNHRFDAASRAYSNDSTVALYFFALDGAPINLADMSLQWDGDPLAIPADGSTFRNSRDENKLTVQWPYAFRSLLRDIEDHQTNWLVISNIKDGAGNPAPEMKIPFVADFARDTIAPTLLAATFPTNVLWTTGFENVKMSGLPFKKSSKKAVLDLRREPGEAPYLRFDNAAKGGITNAWISHTFAKTQRWKPSTHRWLAFRFRRPVMSADDKTRLDIRLNIGKKVNHVLHLSGETPVDGAIRVTDFTWRPNQWHSVILDVTELLQSEAEQGNLDDMIESALSDKEMKGAAELDKMLIEKPILSLSIHQHNADGIRPLDIECVHILSDWQPADELVLNAYDASGIDGVSWWVENRSPDLAVTPGSARQPPQAGDWLTLRVRDNAGNLSHPVHIPVCGDNMPGVFPRPEESASAQPENGRGS